MLDDKKKTDLAARAKSASIRAYSPYSKACVGAAVLTSDGHVFEGCNIENSSYGGTTCAEQVAILKAVSEGHTRLAHVFVYTEDGWPPCGICRQMMSEFATPELQVTLVDGKGGQKNFHFFREILPLAFTPGHLDNIKKK